MKKHLLHLSFRSSPFGPVAIIWSVHEGRPRIRRILLPKPGASAEQLVTQHFPNANMFSCSEIDAICDRIEKCLNGGSVKFSLEIARLDFCSVFQQKVLLATYRIPRGSVSTYNLIANHLGNPGAARAVGTALATNPFPILIPCHRVVRSDGALGGYQGGAEMKRSLLEMEGVPFRDADHVTTQAQNWPVLVDTKQY